MPCSWSLCCWPECPPGRAPQSYNPITPTKAGETITLTGKNMTVQEVVDIARHGAKVRVSAAHRQGSADNLELVLEGARQEVPIYGFNRGGGAEREVVIFEGDPLAPEPELLIQRRYDGFRLTGVHGGGEQHTGLGPEVADEEVVRAQMAVTLNRMRYSGMNPALVDLLIAMLNERIAPVVIPQHPMAGANSWPVPRSEPRWSESATSICGGSGCLPARR